MDGEGCNDGATPQERDGNGCNDGTTPQEQQTEAQEHDGNDYNDGTTPQEQQTEAQQHDDNGCDNGTTPQEQQMEAQQQDDNGCDNGTTPQEQQMEEQEPEGNEDEGNEDKMYLFLDDASDYIEDELDEDSVSTEEPQHKCNFISIRQKIEIAEAAVRGETSPGFTLRGLAWENNLQEQSNSTLYQIIATTEKAGAQERGDPNEALW